MYDSLIFQEMSNCFVYSLVSYARSSQHAVQQQSGRPHPGACGASAQPHVPREALTATHPGALLRLPIAEVCLKLLPLLHQ